MLAEAYTVSRIQIAPLKSGGLVVLEEGLMTPEGMQTLDGVGKDHEFFAVRYKADQNGIHHFVTQRSVEIPGDPNGKKDHHRKLALVKPSIIDGVQRWGWEHHRAEQVEVERPASKGEVLQTQIWDHQGPAVEVPHLTEWLNDVAGTDLRVMRTSGPWERKVSEAYVPNPYMLRAQDGYPIHAILTADVQAVSESAGLYIPSNRYRAQIELQGGDAWSLHEMFAGVMEGAVVIQTKPCGRCPMPGYDQETGTPTRRQKPLYEIEKMRPKWISKSGNEDIIFGENWIVNKEVIVRTGSVLTPIAARFPALQYAVR